MKRMVGFLISAAALLSVVNANAADAVKIGAIYALTGPGAVAGGCPGERCGRPLAHGTKGTDYHVWGHRPWRQPAHRLKGVEAGTVAEFALAVEDSGPGLSPDFVARGVSGAGGTGLGLDIARRTAEGAGGVFRIGRAAAGGARIALELPTTGPPPERSPR